MPTYTYTDLNVPLAGAGGTFALSINGSGQVVGIFWDGGPNEVARSDPDTVHGFIYSNGTYTVLTDPLASTGQQGGTVTVAVNHSGQVVGYYYDNNQLSHAFLYSNGTYNNIPDPSGALYTFATSINSSGQVAGWYVDSSNLEHGFIYSNETYTILDDPLAGPGGTAATWINASGQVVGSYLDSNGAPHGFIYSNGTYTDLTDPSGNGISTQPSCINDAGQVVGQYVVGVDPLNNVDITHGFIYSNGIFTDISDPLAGPAVPASPNDQPGGTNAVWINASGDVVGVYQDSSDIQHAFLYSNGTYTTLDVSGHVSSVVINDSGDIAGTFSDPQGFLATPLDRPPVIDSARSTPTGTVNERPLVTGSNALDQVAGIIAFNDPDTADRPTAKVLNQTVVCHDAHGNVFALSSNQLAAFEGEFSIKPEDANTNNGIIDWTYNITDNALDFLGVGQNVVVNSTIQIDDHNGGTVTQDVTVTINGSNDNPVASADTVLVQIQQGVTVDAAHGVLANDSDPDGDHLTVSAVLGLGSDVGTTVPGLHGSLILNSDGSYTYTVTDLTGATGSHLHEVFHYTVSDGQGGTASANLDITLNRGPAASNDAASVATALGGGGTVPVNAAHGVLINDSDPDADHLTVSGVSGGTVGTPLAGAHGKLTLNADGSYSYAVTNVTGSVSTDGHLHDVFTYRASDGNGGLSTASLDISLKVQGETFNGGNGGQTHTGTIGDDIINGGNGKDTLFGGAGDDIINGGNGVDFLNGGLGNDTLTGGNGHDTFAFNAKFGHDTITDFAGDTIQFDHAIFANFAAVQSHMGNDTHGNAVITLDANDTVTVLGVSASQLHASDFVFV